MASRRVIFLDRDGVINEDNGNGVKNWNEFIFMKNSIEGLRMLSKNFDLYIVTNQSRISKGLYTEKDLERIHDNMKKEFEKNEIKIKGIFYCKHMPSDNCDCRKPKTGMISHLIKNMDIKNSFFIGDTTIDIQTGKNTGCKTILVKTGHGGSDKTYDTKPDFIAVDLKHAADIILKEAVL